MNQQGKPKYEPGIGATEPHRGIEAQAALETLIGMPLTKGYGRCALTIGVEAAEALIELVTRLGVQKSDLPAKEGA